MYFRLFQVPVRPSRLRGMATLQSRASKLVMRTPISRECLGHHRKGTPGIEMCIMCLMSDSIVIAWLLSAECMSDEHMVIHSHAMVRVTFLW